MRRLWLPVVVGALAFAAGTWVERYRGLKDTNALLTDHVTCLEGLHQAELTIDRATPLLRSLWPDMPELWGEPRQVRP